MARLAIGVVLGIVVTVIGGAALGIKAQDEGYPSMLADTAGIPAVDLQGALNSQPGVDAHTYLTFLGAFSPVGAAVGVGRGVVAPPNTATARVRLTYYVLTGRTYSGGRPYLGSTACSWNFAIGTRFVFRDGESVVCNDRGLLGSSGWLDVWGNPALVRKYGTYASVGVTGP